MTPEERLDRIEAILDKHNDAIRDLIVVGRTCLNSIQEIHGSLKELRDAQATTDEKLNILIATVDRIIRQRNGSE